MTRNLRWFRGSVLAPAIGFAVAGCTSTGATPQGGGDENARRLESLGFFNIQLGYGLKMGTDIGFKLVH